MEEEVREKTEYNLPPVSNIEASIRHFQEGLATGKHWYISLLESIGLWTNEIENLQGRQYHYLIQGEAFDWLLLAERLCDTVDGFLPEKEKFALLFENRPPISLTAQEFKDLIGPDKYHRYLNYFYGITVEEALIQATREDVRKERLSNCWKSKSGEDDEAYIRIYGSTRTALLKEFRKIKHIHQLISSNITELKEFTYWCFKYRVRTCEKAKVASDTFKALEWLRRNGFQGYTLINLRDNDNSPEND